MLADSSFSVVCDTNVIAFIGAFDDVDEHLGFVCGELGGFVFRHTSTGSA
jgi:hypothetical protein